MATQYEFRNMLLSYLVGREKAQPKIDVRPHFIPITRDVLVSTLGKHVDTNLISVDSFVDLIIAEAKSAKYVKPNKRVFFTGSTLRDGTGKVITKATLGANTPSAVFDGGVLVGLLFSTESGFKSAYDSLFKKFLNKSMSKYLILNEDSKTKREFHVGHLDITTDDGKTLGYTPATMQVDDLIKGMSRLSLHNDDAKNAILAQVQNSLASLRQDFQVHEEYSTQVKATLSKSFTSALLSVGANIVIIQEGYENSRVWGPIETKLIADVKKILTKIHFSRNYEEEIALRVVETLQGRVVKNTSSGVHIEVFGKHKGKMPISIPKKVPGNYQHPQQPKGMSKLRTLTGKFFSVVSLQNLLNAGLHDQIQKNMGKGRARTVLNYRTGRLARSATVKSIIRTRDDQLSVFYTYMRYPYGTFEPGGRQGFPVSRDPKLLISKSIREIAATMVGNKLRAVRL